METIISIISFFKSSSKRNIALRKTVGQKHISLCETGWIERHDSILQFRSALDKICSALLLVSLWNKQESVSKAHILHLAIMDASFIITLICLADALALTLPLSRLFQSKNIDLQTAQNHIIYSLIFGD